jgi:hypothetical protein
MAVPTLYKARGMSVKRPVCAICVDRTRGLTVLVRLTHGVTVWLCESHASSEFQRRRGGRDFVLTLQRLWGAHGCLTAARSRALSAHLTEVAGPRQVRRPGSYAWAALRTLAEEEFARGGPPLPTIRRLRGLHSGGSAAPPSVRTMLRWHRERRWLHLETL